MDIVGIVNNNERRTIMQYVALRLNVTNLERLLNELKKIEAPFSIIHLSYTTQSYVLLLQVNKDRLDECMARLFIKKQ